MVASSELSAELFPTGVKRLLRTCDGVDRMNQRTADPVLALRLQIDRDERTLMFLPGEVTEISAVEGLPIPPEIQDEIDAEAPALDETLIKSFTITLPMRYVEHLEDGRAEFVASAQGIPFPSLEPQPGIVDTVAVFGKVRLDEDGEPERVTATSIMSISDEPMGDGSVADCLSFQRLVSETRSRSRKGAITDGAA